MASEAQFEPRKALDRVRKRTVKALDRSGIVLAETIKGLISIAASPRFGPSAAPPGEPPGLRSGRLRRSIQTFRDHLEEPNPRIQVGTSGLVYARIHEFGGIIVPKRKKVLVFKMPATNEYLATHEDVGGMMTIFAKKVYIPARPYLRPALALARDWILQVCKKAMA